MSAIAGDIPRKAALGWLVPIGALILLMGSVFISRGVRVSTQQGGQGFASWSAVSGATGYRMYWDTDSGAPYRYYCDVGNVTSIASRSNIPASCEPLVDGTWNFSVTATDPAGFQGASATEQSSKVVSGLKTACNTTLSSGGDIAAAVSSATAGNIVCLNDGSYSGFTLSGVTKSPRVRVRAGNASGVSITSAITITGGTSGISIDLSSPSNSLYVLNVNGASTANITVRQFDALHQIVVDGPTGSTPNILIENFTQIDLDVVDILNGLTQGVDVENAGGSPRTTPLATFRNFVIDGDCADGFQPGTALVVEDGIIRNKNELSCSVGSPHTDAYQECCGQGDFEGTIIRRNYIANNSQTVTAFDGVDHVLIENNLIDPGTLASPRASIEWYDDDSSIMRYNTIIYRDAAANGGIELNTRGSPGGSGTQVYDNIVGVIDVVGVTTAVNTNNCVRSGSSPNIVGTPTFVGGTFPSTFADALQTGGSACKGVGQGGIDPGIQFLNLPAPQNFVVNPAL